MQINIYFFLVKFVKSTSWFSSGWVKSPTMMIFMKRNDCNHIKIHSHEVREEPSNWQITKMCTQYASIPGEHVSLWASAKYTLAQDTHIGLRPTNNEMAYSQEQGFSLSALHVFWSIMSVVSNIVCVLFIVKPFGRIMSFILILCILL